MRWLDWLIVGGYLTFIVWDGLRRTKNSDKVDGFFLGNRSNPWWAVGLSVMATQLSAITLVGTTGQGYRDGLRFVQFYFGLPLAMIILSVTAVPFFYRAGVYTAYEYLERRFDAKTRTLTSALFLLSRGLQCGVIIAAPSVILSVVMGWSLPLTVLAIGLPTAVYTMLGGVQAVTWTDVKQMVVIVAAVCAAVATLVIGLPSNVSLGEALHVAGATGRLHGDRLQLRSEQHLHVLVRAHRRAVPDAVVLRLRSEPGAALPDGEVGGRGAPVAVRERLREDPAPGVDSADRRAGVHALPVRASADALQPDARPHRAGDRRRPRTSPRSTRNSVRRSSSGATPQRRSHPRMAPATPRPFRPHERSSSRRTAACSRSARTLSTW